MSPQTIEVYIRTSNAKEQQRESDIHTHTRDEILPVHIVVGVVISSGGIAYVRVVAEAMRNVIHISAH